MHHKSSDRQELINICQKFFANNEEQMLIIYSIFDEIGTHLIEYYLRDLSIDIWINQGTTNMSR